MRELDADVVVVGSGAAGLTAALKAREAGARVLLACKGALGKTTCSAMTAGIFSSASGSYSEEEHYRATMAIGRGINDHALVEAIVAGGRAILTELMERGVPLLNTPTGFKVDDARSDGIPGVRFVKALKELTLASGVSVLTGFHCHGVAKEGNRATGVTGMDSKGEKTTLKAGAVVLATGGGGALYQRTDNPPAAIGEGYALALEAGCRLRDMEFVQFYPIGFAERGLPEFLVFPPYPPGSLAVDSRGNNVLPELGDCKDLNEAIIRFRDTSSLLFWRKHREGGLFLDMTAVAPEAWDKSFSLRHLAKSSFDFRHKRCAIAPITHFFMGGVCVDASLSTGIEGLYAAGEITGGLHGANRMGGNALTECLAGGQIAGKNAAAHAASFGANPSGGGEEPPGAPARPTRNGSDQLDKGYGRLNKLIRLAAWEDAGIERDAAGMAGGLAKVEKYRAQLRELPVRGPLEQMKRRELDCSLLVLEAILTAGLTRKESRGAFYRKDYPVTDEAWERSITLRLDGEGRVKVVE